MPKVVKRDKRVTINIEGRIIFNQEVTPQNIKYLKDLLEDIK